MLKNNVIAIDKPCYAMVIKDGNKAEITMYGDIVESRPKAFWTDEEIEGQFIVCDEFLEDLKEVEGCKKITLRMNSCGGNAGVSILIHNRLRELVAQGKKITCIVDGVAMSGGSLIMCACDTVQVNPSSLIMIHKCWCDLWGGYNADELRELATKQDAYDKAQVSIYQRKTELSEEEILRMMAATTYMTGTEAKEKGFADEVLEGEALPIAASADGHCLYVKDRKVHLAPGMIIPDNIPKVDAGTVPENTNTSMSETDKGGKNMANTIEELRAENPELVTELESATRAEAAQTEQRRLQEIDEVAALLDPALVQEAKYGANTCTAQELTFRAAQAAAQKRTAFLTGMGIDAAPAAAVPAAQPPVEQKTEKTAEQLMAEARANVAKLFPKED